MTVFTVEVKGARKIARDLERFPAKATHIYGKAVQDAGAVYRDFTKKMPAVSAKTTGYGAKGIPVDSGRLRGSIRKKKLMGLAAGVGPDVKYGAPVHEGVSSRNVPPRPFMEWSLEMGAQKLIDRIFINASKKLP